jgi:hypothetical protein
MFVARKFPKKSIWHMRAYAPVTGKIFQNVKNSIWHVKFRRKPTLFAKDIKMFRAKPFLASNFVFLRITQNYNFFVKQLCEHIEHRELSAKYFVLNIF